MRQPALMNTLAGVSAALAANLCTEIVLTPIHTASVHLFLASLLWFSAALCLALAGGLSDDARRKSDRLWRPELPKKSVKETEEVQWKRVHKRVQRYLLTSFVLFTFGLLILRHEWFF